MNTNTNTKLKFREDVKKNDEYKRIQAYITDPAKKNILKKMYFSKDWLVSNKLAFLYIQDPNKSWENYIYNIEFLQQEALKKGTTFEPSYNDIAKVWKYKCSSYENKRYEENNIDNINNEIEQKLKLAEKNKTISEQRSIQALQSIHFNNKKKINNKIDYIENIKLLDMGTLHELGTLLNNMYLSEKK